MRHLRFTSILLSLAVPLALTAPVAQGEILVRMETSIGYVDIELFDETAPVTVANFLNYVRRGDYDDSFIHRSAVTQHFLFNVQIPFIIQGGGYRHQNGEFNRVPEDAPIVNEYDPNDSARSNTRGTIAMAKLPSGPDTATNQWFFNLGNNAFNLNNQNGGFTVFGRVHGSNGDTDTTNDGPSMQVVDAIAALNRFNGTGLDPRYDSAWTEIPLIGFVPGQTFVPQEHLVFIRSVRELSHLRHVTSNAGGAVVLTTPLPARIASVTASDTPNASGMPSNVQFSQGFFSFEVTGVTPGGTAMVSLQLPEDYVPNTYWMYGPTPSNASPHWYEFNYDGRTGAEFFGNNHVVLHFIDGQRGDADLSVNGRIVDPGAPGIGPAATSPSSSGGGGCTLTTNPDRRGGALDIILMVMAVLSLRRLGRRKHRKADAFHP